jgi:hypothetical protein
MTSARDLAPIDPEHLYPLAVFQRISGLGKFAMRTARKRGLRILYDGDEGRRQAFVLGRDFIDFLQKGPAHHDQMKTQGEESSNGNDSRRATQKQRRSERRR